MTYTNALFLAHLRKALDIPPPGDYRQLAGRLGAVSRPYPIQRRDYGEIKGTQK